MNREKQPELLVLEPWWRAWVWAYLPKFCATIGFAVGAVAGYFLALQYFGSQNEAPGKKNDMAFVFFIFLPGLICGSGGGKVGASFVKMLRGRSGQEPSTVPSQATENEQSQNLVSDADNSIQRGNS